MKIDNKRYDILDSKNYSVAFTDTKGNIAYINRNFLKRYIRHGMIHSEELNLKEINYDLWLDVTKHRKLKSIDKK